MHPPERGTRTERDERGEGAGSLADHLFRVLSCDAPWLGGARHRLDGRDAVDVVTIGRGDEPVALRRAAGPLRELAVRLPDPWMSSVHAELVRAGTSLVLVDRGSKNGTRRNGELVTRCPLVDGDVVEVGRTLFRYRASLPDDPSSPPDLSIGGAGVAPGLATLVPGVARELERLAAAARSQVPIEIRGESGTGKERAARAVHLLSRRPGRLVAVDCGGLPRDLVEGELYGHRRGAFSGALHDHLGLVRAADHGTLFLDEIGDLAPGAQAAFLRVLQEAEVRAIGDVRPVAVDVRIVSATHRDLEALVARGDFRADLRARLAGVTVTLPPLRARIEDLGLLVAEMLGAAAGRATLSREAALALLRYPWPLNVRELGRALAGAVALTPAGSAIALGALPAALQVAAASPTAARSADREEQLDEADAARRAELVSLLEAHGGNLAAVARAFGKGRFQVHRWLRRYRVDVSRFRRPGR